MKISGIDKDIESIIYYLDSNGFKPYASCDGVIENHEKDEEVGEAYIAFLKSPKIIELMSAFFLDKENFSVTLKSEEHSEPHELYGNIISGNIYQVSFSNQYSERTDSFENIIRNIVEGKEVISSKEKTQLEILDKILEENSNSDVAFEVNFNRNYQPHMNKSGKINELIVTTKVGDEKVDGDIILKNEIDMNELANILSKKYNMPKKEDSFEEKYQENEFIFSQCDRCSCLIYFTDEHFPQILEMIQYIRDIAHTLPTFESKEWIGDYEETFDDEYDEMWQLEDDEFDKEIMEEQKTALEQREEILIKLEEESEQLTKLEQMIEKFRAKDENSIGE